MCIRDSLGDLSWLAAARQSGKLTFLAVQGVVATLGGGTYSRAFGNGKRTMLNPYVGARVGYAYLDHNYFTVAAEVGVEVYKERGVLLSVSARPTGLIGRDSQGAIETGATLGVAGTF